LYEKKTRNDFAEEMKPQYKKLCRLGVSEKAVHAFLKHRTEPDLVVARDGVEPPTRGFSVRCSTN
jgi:hypothetical protein